MDNTSSPRIRIEDLLPENQLSEEEMARIVGAGGPSRAQLGVEELENRELMASQLIASLSKGVLNIEGTKRADTIQLQVRDDRVEVSGTLIRTPNGRVDSIPVDEVARIKINALAGDDRIFMDPDLLQSAKILGGAGNDLMAGGNAAHAMIGGAGVNDIIPASVADVLLAEAAVYKHENGTLFHFAGPNKWVPLGAVDKLIRDEAGRVLTLQGSSLSRANGGQLHLLSDSVKDAVAFGGGPLVLFEDSHLGRWDGNAITSYQNEVANLVGFSGAAGEPEVLVLFRDGTLFRFNGTDSTEPIDAGGPVQALAQSADGFYYVLQGGWLYRYDGSSFHQLAEHGGRVQALVEAADGHAYYLSGGTLFRLGINGTASQAIAAGGPVQALVQAADDNAYILQGGTIYRFDGTGFVQIADHAGLVQQLAPASDGRAYALSGGDLYHFNGTALVEKIYSGGPVHAVVQGADGQAYILAGGWLYRYLGGQNNFVQIPDHGGHIQALAQASDGHAYALSDGDLYRLGVRGVLNEQIYAGGPVEALAQAADGQGYILAGGWLYRYLGGQNNFVQIANNTQALVQGGDGNAYVLSSGVLRRFDGTRLAEAINTGGTVQALGQLGDGKVYFRQDGARFSFAGGNRPEAIQSVTLDRLARSLQEAGLGAVAIAAGLKQLGEPDYHAALALYRSAGVSPTDIAVALGGAYQDTDVQAAQALRNAGVSPTDIAVALGGAYRDTDILTAKALYQAGVSPTDIAVALGGAYRDTDVLTAKALYQAGVSPTDIAVALGGAYRDNPGQVAQAMLSAEIDASHVAICRTWLEMGGPGGFLGLPTSGVNQGDGFQWQDFQHGVIYHSPGTGAHAILGNPNDPNTFWGKFKATGFERGLGLPLSDVHQGNGFQWQEFQNGALYTTPSGISVLTGPLYQEYLAAGRADSALGVPVSPSATLSSDGVGQVFVFRNGLIYWSPSTAHLVSTSAEVLTAPVAGMVTLAYDAGLLLLPDSGPPVPYSRIVLGATDPHWTPLVSVALPNDPLPPVVPYTILAQLTTGSSVETTADGWQRVRGEEIGPQQYLEFGVAVAASIATSNPWILYEHLKSYLIDSLQTIAQNLGAQIVTDLVARIASGEREIRIDHYQFRFGILTETKQVVGGVVGNGIDRLGGGTANRANYHTPYIEWRQV